MKGLKDKSKGSTAVNLNYSKSEFSDLLLRVRKGTVVDLSTIATTRV